MQNVRILGTALPILALAISSCGGGSGFATPTSIINRGAIALSPAAITVGAGTSTAFTALLPANLPSGGSLTWSVNPPAGGTMNTNGGVALGSTGGASVEGTFIASATAGSYTISATWTPAIGGTGAILNGSATVAILPVPQVENPVNNALVQSGGGNQAAGAIQNGAVVGQSLPTVTQSNGTVQNRGGFGIPPLCSGSSTGCR